MYDVKLNYPGFNTAVKRGFKEVKQSEVDQAKSLLAEVSKLSDEDLKKRGLKMGEPLLINRLNSNVALNKSMLSVDEAVSLLRLVPFLAKNSKNSAHTTTLVATPIVKQALQEKPSKAFEDFYKSIICSAGAVCFKGKMRCGLSAEIQKQEYELLAPFVKGTDEFKADQQRVVNRQRHKCSAIPTIKEAPYAVCISSHKSIDHLPKDEFAYVRKD